ncbi:acyltransferase [Pseudomonas sp. WJP1]|uniref:acyltransferase family protein n=1 Tax=Pseudomonas sp. WJP1 TaxID=2986947 RepID=UPI00234BE115|nr:acyltransferase [Pseudomonas sp. WJP1]WCM53512.1 acyltransferase [Pseudomonas sp. WJP1]
MSKTNHYQGADGIRGFACLIVLLVHASAFFFADTFKALAGAGKIGVWLFFVLSAFLLTSKFESSGFSRYSLFTYALGRFLRIVPIFTIVAFLYYWLGTANIGTAQDLQNAILFKQGFAHLWTIPVEFKFYAFLPIFAFLLISAKRFGGDLGAALCAVVLVVGQQYFWPYWNSVPNGISTHWYLSSFTIGCYFAVSMDFYRRYVTDSVATLVAACVLILMILSSPIMRNILLDMPMDNWLLNKFVYLSFFWGLFVVVLADGNGCLGKVMKSVVMKKIGAWSFSIYLVHWYFYVTFALAHPNSFSWMIIAVLCAIVVGAILHYIVEAPIERFRHSIQLRFKQVAVTA